HGSCTISRSSARPPPVSDEWRRDHPDVPVRGIVGMRNALAHGYFEIDADAVWNVVERDLPVLAGRLSSVKEPARHDTGQDDRAARAFDADMRRGAADTRRRGHRETPSAGGPVLGGVHDLVGEGPARDERRVLRSAALVAPLFNDAERDPSSLGRVVAVPAAVAVAQYSVHRKDRGS
ncbi:MAG: DUF86 domain-containing protein, partial [Actinomycetota bacterium]|nr:DUF86 domain-containing protein [Actinomycetota bacterium]